MKKIILLSSSLLLSAVIFAQSNKDRNSDDKPQKKYETIRIIDGDTVSHDIRIMKVQSNEAEMEMRQQRMHNAPSGEMTEEMREIIEEVDIYILTDDAQKEGVVRRMQMHSKDFESIFSELEEDEDLIVDMSNDRREIKIIKINIKTMYPIILKISRADIE